MAPKENSLKKIYGSEFLQSSFIFVPCGNTPPSKYGQEWAQVERDDYVNLGEDSILMAFFENIVD